MLNDMHEHMNFLESAETGNVVVAELDSMNEIIDWLSFFTQCLTHGIDIFYLLMYIVI